MDSGAVPAEPTSGTTHGDSSIPLLQNCGSSVKSDQPWTPLLNNPSVNDVPIPERPLGTRKKMRIGILGAGVSGLCLMKVAEERLSNVDVVCYEKNADIGGTWLENRYPGCACDIPSVAYQFPWRPWPWKNYYSSSKDIWAYLKAVEQENDFIKKYIKLRHHVKGLSWKDEDAKWVVEVENLQNGELLVDQVDVIVNGTGILNRWKWPEIAGIHDFKGKLIHSANWDPEVDLKDKKVALIGAGSSAVQILPSIYDQVSRVYHWVRSKIWVTAGFAQEFAGENGGNFAYSDTQTQLFNRKDAYLTYCKMIEGDLNRRFKFVINGSEAQREARRFAEKEMRINLANRPDLIDQVIPTDFFVGCRRPTPGLKYLQALASAKTTVYNQQLNRITANGCIDPSGKEQEVDVIICATGFDTSYRPRFRLMVNGQNVPDSWIEEVPSYLSLAVAGVPNYFTSGGAYFPSAHGSFFPLIQGSCEYIAEVIDKMQLENITSLRPKPEVTRQFSKFADSFLKRTAWTGPCSSWFKGGKVDAKPTIWPGSRLHFLRLIEKPRYEDFAITYEKENMFSFLGNGFHVCESDGSDITWYLGATETHIDEQEVREVMDGLKGKRMAGFEP
ncbi:uncharacterized protein Z520_05278 [Fonsecaea multimorphosa CBS 102226]|uniref:Uncharacterized protein n=1 Tax=Fonsecaea multimorphosa CBS 102226 TaxID=1442371 RepID=A0A0D2JZ67_9EURO|nr:uncharacterized protein Z520_05278 [Fonsecaea multimorphosa CBS 102226]KIX98817.1 hypothetical protein Z520_05278 [Fonsecaea multimorphosa CBS 102226]OAL25097.1 hypothetical protein AYO22_04974 [Fonsecaea multimorphosa]